ncbi:DUF1295-domain-containing protein [Gonapodya prolifera JEL478]|uniref:DUF1295-domain-containing protein n=1 Tax=Gonapodya prolifera (strain JEL478) TaxID=1344416 RepID=A0A139AID1_GONPJ|nr:DUF1295-domain-containing protein [Gonapodya prolifera JEL478]|eukprot:KXS16508.1 DUF1295-domain-containing protein [Gonapodya prolifera JEL478]
MPLPFAPLLLPFFIDVGIQLACYVVAAAFKTEVFYDLSGSVTYLACFLTSLLVRGDSASLSQLNPRQIVATSLSCLWCARLGSFLFIRVLYRPDHRFDELKSNPIKFLIPWTFQIAWIWLTAWPVYVVNSNDPAEMRAWGEWASDWVGLVLWVVGFAIEAIADQQKNTFKNKHPKEFMRTGLYRYSRYPNYFGEMTLWFGMYILCIAGFTRPWQYVTTVSPFFVVALITQVSGIPLLEKGYKERYGSDPAWQEYVATTSFLVPLPPKRSPREKVSPMSSAGV